MKKKTRREKFLAEMDAAMRRIAGFEFGDD